MFEKPKNIDFVLISFNTAELTYNCIKSIYDTTKVVAFNIILVDNNSNDNTIELIKKSFPLVTIIQNNDNFGYAKAVNIGAKVCKFDFFVISNTDVIFLENTIELLLKHLDKKTGVVSPQQIFPDGKWQRSHGNYPGILFGLKDLFFITTLNRIIKPYLYKIGLTKNKIKQVPYCDGAVLLVNKTAFDEVNGFDEDYFFFTEEIDFCYKLKMNKWNIQLNTYSEVIHYRGFSRKQSVNLESIKLLYTTKILFANKHLSNIETYFYVIFELGYFYNLKIIFSFLDFIKKNQSSKLAEINQIIDVWKNKLKG